MGIGYQNKRRMPGVRKAAGRFLREEEGSLTVFGIYAGVLTLMLSGIAVDVMHYESVRTAIQNTADTATLAATNLDQTLDPTAVVNDYFAKAGMSQYLKSVTVTSLMNSRQVDVTASTSVPSMFMQLEGINSLTSNNHSTAVQSIGNVEIALALDNSGSMNQQAGSGTPSTVCKTRHNKWYGTSYQSCHTTYTYITKIQALRDAANQFVDTIYGQANSDTVTMSLVPYDAHVNVGPDLMAALNVAPSGYSSPTMCIDENGLDFSTTKIDATQTFNRFPNFQDGYYYPGPEVCDSSSNRNSVVFSNNTTDLHSAINAMVAGGNTSIDLATKWAAATLDPGFQPVVDKMILNGKLSSTYAGRPAQFSDHNYMKVLIVMTDGDNTTREDLAPAYQTGPSPVWYDSKSGIYSYYDKSNSQYFVVSNSYYSSGYWASAPYGTNPAQLSYPTLWSKMTVWTYANNVVAPATGANGYSTWSAMTVFTDTNAENANLQSVCSAAKNEGILVYTIGFQTDAPGAAQLQQCATDSSFYFDAQGTDITSVFSKIAASIQHLRLTQ